MLFCCEKILVGGVDTAMGRRMNAHNVAVLREIFVERRDQDEACCKFGVDQDYLHQVLDRVKLALSSIQESEQKSSEDPSPIHRRSEGKKP